MDFQITSMFIETAGIHQFQRNIYICITSKTTTQCEKQCRSVSRHFNISFIRRKINNCDSLVDGENVHIQISKFIDFSSWRLISDNEQLINSFLVTCKYSCCFSYYVRREIYLLVAGLFIMSARIFQFPTCYSYACTFENISDQCMLDETEKIICLLVVR